MKINILEDYEYKKYTSALRQCAKEHANDKTDTCNIVVSNLCDDTATLIEKLESEIDSLKKENHDLLIKYDIARDASLRNDRKEIEKIHNSINKTIEDVKDVSFKHKFEQGEYPGEVTEVWTVVKLDHVLDFFKRNLLDM